MLRGLILKLNDILFSSSICSLVLLRSNCADDRDTPGSFLVMVKFGPLALF